MKEIKYLLSRGYEATTFFETRVLEQAVTVAVAASLSVGAGIAVKRTVSTDNDGRYQGQTIELFRINPSTTDFRQAAPELVLAMNAMAHELCNDIHNVIQPKVEGDQQ